MRLVSTLHVFQTTEMKSKDSRLLKACWFSNTPFGSCNEKSINIRINDFLPLVSKIAKQPSSSHMLKTISVIITNYLDISILSHVVKVF